MIAYLLPTQEPSTQGQAAALGTALGSHSTAAAKSLQSCPTLCDPIDGSPPGSSVPGILQVRILEWVAISFSNAGMHAESLQSCLTLCKHQTAAAAAAAAKSLQLCPTLCNPIAPD